MKKRAACLVALLTIALSSHAQQADSVPQLFPGMNVSLETLDLFGVFYHRQKHFPEIRQVSDLAAVKLVRPLEKPEQEGTDFNTFVLDSTQGVTLFSLGLQGLGATAVPRFRGATRMAVLPNGRLAVILADGSVDLCAAFDGDSIRSDSGCTALPMNAASVAASGTDDVFVLTKSGVLEVIDSITGEQEILDVPLASIREIHSDGETFAFIYAGGRSVATFRNVGGHCAKEWEAWRNCQRSSPNPGKTCNDSRSAFQACKKANPGLHTVRFKLVQQASTDSVAIPFADGTSTGPLDLSSLARNADGRTYVLCPSLDLIAILDRDLQVLAAVVYFPQRPRPLRRVTMARGVRLAPASGLLHVFSTKAIETFWEVDPSLDALVRQTPPELLPIYAAIAAIPASSILADPTQDITARPEIQELIVQAIANLQLK
jgi:hypothetical protein